MADLNALVLFATVAEANGFSEAARRLRMPVSTVSRRIAEFEDQLGVRLIERSTRHLRLTPIGAEIVAYARRGAALSDEVDRIVSHQLSEVSGILRLSAPPSMSDSLLTPLIGGFQAAYPAVRVQVRVTDRFVDHIAESVDLAFRVGVLKDSSLVARRVLNYRHRLVATPAYLAKGRAPETPQDLLGHRLVAFTVGRAESRWTFTHLDGRAEVLVFEPALATNDYAGVVASLMSGDGIGDLPPVVRPELVREGRLVEVMPDWRLPSHDLSLVHLGTRHATRPVRVFVEFAAQFVPGLFPELR